MLADRRQQRPGIAHVGGGLLGLDHPPERAPQPSGRAVAVTGGEQSQAGRSQRRPQCQPPGALLPCDPLGLVVGGGGLGPGGRVDPDRQVGDRAPDLGQPVAQADELELVARRRELGERALGLARLRPRLGNQAMESSARSSAVLVSRSIARPSAASAAPCFASPVIAIAQPRKTRQRARYSLNPYSSARPAMRSVAAHTW